ncbi:MAG TPA: RraA family protein [Candidatus Dormibacteraeota bacterium]
MNQMLAALARYDTPTLSNGIETFDIRPRDQGFASMEIRCLFPELGTAVGYAATAMIRARGKGPDDQSPLWRHVQEVPEPRFVVVQDLDDPPGHGSLWGEVNATIFKALGCVGAITNGCVRDLKEAREMGFQFFARGPGVSHAYVRVVTAGGEVSVGSLAVRPGELLAADQHGVLSIPLEIAEELPAACDRVIEREQNLLRWVRSDEFDPAKLAEMRRVRH